MRPRSMVLLAVFVLVVGACGRDASVNSSGEDPSDQRAPTTEDDGLFGPMPDGHSVSLVDLEVHGPLSEFLAVDVHHGVTMFPVGGPAQLTVELAASSDAHVGLLPFHHGTASATSGEGVLGHSGICGQGWDQGGQPGSVDPCPAADPVSDVPGGGSVDVPVLLYRSTDEGDVAPGEYRVVIPLAEDSELVLVLRLVAVPCQRGPATTIAGVAGGGEYTCGIR